MGLFDERAHPTSVADTLSIVDRSRRMSLVRGKNTKPEMLVRSMVHRAGFRYRLHLSSLPGKPDLVFPGKRKDHLCAWLLLAQASSKELPIGALTKEQTRFLGD